MNVLVTLFCVVCGFQVIVGQIDVKQQIFRVQSQDIKAKEGDDVILHCEIENRAGKVQWTMDGMALGYNPVIPGHPRYQVIGDETKGIFNLKIENVSLDDDAEFQCQVGPKIISEKERFAPNRSIVRLNVITPPSSVQMIDHANNTKVAVLENQELKLTCLVRNSKPPANVIWHRGRTELKLEQTNEIYACRTGNKSKMVNECSVRSTIVIKPSLIDDSVNYSCEARHEALPQKMSMFTSVQLTVLYPPEPPHIDGYIEGDQSIVLIEGQVFELTCRSSGGNPLAQLVWFKNGAKLQNFTSYRMQGKISASELKINLEPNDNQAAYTCEASNGATRIPIKTAVKLTVSFGPRNVELTGPDDAKAGETIIVECKTTSSNPAAEIQWVIDGQKNYNKTSNLSFADNDGRITTSWLSLVVPKERKEILIYCYGNNPRSSKNVVANKTIHIHYPPGHPVISGYIKGGYITSGATQELLCTSSGGNPLASLTWFKNDQRISSIKKKSDKTSSFAEITVSVSETDNGAVYRCEAVNPTISSPYIDTVRLNVYFPPESATVSIEPNILHTGTLAKLCCNATSSNPPAEITWWKNNAFQMTDGISSSLSSGEYGGNLTFSELILNVTADMHENTITCRATNAVLQQSVNIATELNVMYKPIFSIGPTTFFSKIEGESFAVSFDVKANPENVVFRWIKNKQHLKRYVEGSALTIPALNRNDAGFYTCEAENGEGSNRTSFQLDVKYEAAIINITKVVIVSNGSDAEMKCTVTGNPIESDDVWWVSLHTTDLVHRSETKFYNNASIFTLNKVTLGDMGLFYCIVNNGIGSETNATTRLIIEHAPVSDMTTQLIKIAARTNESAKFICKGSGAPKLDFTWFKDDAMLNKTIDYMIDNKQADELNFSSTLQIVRVRPSNYGKYNCIIRNKLGHVKIVFELFNHSKPDQPSRLRLINVTQNSVTLSWNSDFDGGMPTKFRVRYYPANKESKKNYKIVDNDTLCTVTELLSGVNYIFDVMAFNQLGESNYSAMTVNTTTIMATEIGHIVDSPVEGEGLILLIAAGIGILLLLLNVLIVLVCVCKRSKKSKKGMAGPCNKSIEMYAPNSRSSNDVSSGTLSSLQTEKSINFSASDDNRNHINDDQNDLPISYIIEDINYPFAENDEFKLRNRHDSKEKFYRFPYESGYSTINHFHHLQQMVPLHDCDINSSLNFAHTTSLPGRKRISHLSELCYLRDSSPTPSIPPPMSTISTNAYRHMQPNMLHS